MPRTSRMIIAEKKAVYHAWDVEPIYTVIHTSNHIRI